MNHNFTVSITNHAGQVLAFMLSTDGSYVPAVGDSVGIGYEPEYARELVFATVLDNSVYLVEGLKHVETVLEVKLPLKTESQYKALCFSLLANGWESVDGSFEEKYRKSCD